MQSESADEDLVLRRLPDMIAQRGIEGHASIEWVEVKDDFLEDQIGTRGTKQNTKAAHHEALGPSGTAAGRVGQPTIVTVRIHTAVEHLEEFTAQASVLAPGSTRRTLLVRMPGDLLVSERTAVLGSCSPTKPGTHPGTHLGLCAGRE